MKIKSLREYMSEVRVKKGMSLREYMERYVSQGFPSGDPRAVARWWEPDESSVIPHSGAEGEPTPTHHKPRTQAQKDARNKRDRDRRAALRDKINTPKPAQERPLDTGPENNERPVDRDKETQAVPPPVPPADQTPPPVPPAQNQPANPPAGVDPAGQGLPSKHAEPLRWLQQVLPWRIDQIISKYEGQMKQVLGSVPTATAVNPGKMAGRPNWFQGPQSTWSKKGVGGLVRRVLGGMDWAHPEYEGMSLSGFNQLVERIQPEVDFFVEQAWPDTEKQLAELLAAMKKEIAMEIAKIIAALGNKAIKKNWAAPGWAVS